MDEVEIFEGRENRITMVQTYSKKFHCTYLLQNYPFDTQVGLNLQIPKYIYCLFMKICWIHMKLEEFDQRAAELSPDKMEMESELELSMYRITKWELVYYDGKYREIEI